jgi:hypothetical protein
MAEGDRITTTSSMQPRSATQETAQQVRLREAQAEAAKRQGDSGHVDIAAVVGTIDELVDNIGKEALALPSSDELAAFLNHVNLAKVALLVVAQLEQAKAADAAATDDPA